MKFTRLGAALVLAFGVAAGAQAQSTKSVNASTYEEPVKRENDWSWLGLLGLLGLAGLFRRREHDEPHVHTTHATRRPDNNRVRVYTK